MRSSQENAPSVFNLKNDNGVKVSCTNFGARLISVIVPDRNGRSADVLLGYDNVTQYLSGNPYFGSIIGRYGNRINKGRFSLNGKSYKLDINNGNNSLHGGPSGFHNVFWKVMPEFTNDHRVKFNYHSPDGEEGYPGNLTVMVTYTLTDKNELVIDYEAQTDEPTIINLTSHGYFNLAGDGTGDILDHQLMINADRFTPINAELIPTGELRSVSNTPFDFRRMHKIGDAINDPDQQLIWGEGYDHNWILNKGDDKTSLAAKLIEPASGRAMEVYTTEPGLQFYSGNFLQGEGADIGKGNKKYPRRSALCLEAQHFPDSPNHPDFPTTTLNPDANYHQTTTYRFLVE